MKKITTITAFVVAVTALFGALFQFTHLFDPFRHPRVARIELRPSDQVIRQGDITRFNADLFDRNGQSVTGKTVTWSGSDARIVNVSSRDGAITGVAPGSATITATSDGASGYATVTVKHVAVSSVDIWPSGKRILAGDSFQFEATPRDGDGNSLLDREVRWSSSNDPVATVSAGGLVAGRSQGVATISAYSEGKQARAEVPVDPAPQPPAPAHPPPASAPQPSGTSGSTAPSPPIAHPVPPSAVLHPLKRNVLVHPQVLLMAHVGFRITISQAQHLGACTGRLRLLLGDVLVELTSDSQEVAVPRDGDTSYSFGGTVECPAGSRLRASGTGSVSVGAGRTFVVEWRKKGLTDAHVALVAR
ncbi:MAG TPA: Ig-like domain-containing protein [Anaeromyxobacter sp.]